MRPKTFSELTIKQKFLFFISFFLLLSVLVFTFFNLDTLIINSVEIKETSGCVWKFDNGLLSSLKCPDGLYVDESLVGNYTLVRYYEERKPKREIPFANFTFT